MKRAPNELFDCDRVNSYLESYLLGQVPPPERRGLRLHIHRCAACFEKVTARDPLQLFAPLADQTREEAEWDDFWPAIRGQLDEHRPALVRRAAAWAGLSPWRPARGLALAAIAVVLVALAVLIPRLPREAGVPVPEAAETELAIPAAPVFAARVSGPVPQTVEQVRSAGTGEIQVFSMTYLQDETLPVGELILIVDEGLEL